MEKVPVGPSFNRASCRGATYRVAGLASGSGRSLLLYWSLRTARRRSSFDLHLRFSQNPREGSQHPPHAPSTWDDDLIEALRVSNSRSGVNERNLAARRRSRGGAERSVHTRPFHMSPLLVLLMAKPKPQPELAPSSDDDAHRSAHSNTRRRIEFFLGPPMTDPPHAHWPPDHPGLPSQHPPHAPWIQNFVRSKKEGGGLST